MRRRLTAFTAKEYWQLTGKSVHGSLEDISIKQERHEAVLRPPQEEVSPLKIITAMPAALSPRRAAFVVFGIELHLNDSHSFKY